MDIYIVHAIFILPIMTIKLWSIDHGSKISKNKELNHFNQAEKGLATQQVGGAKDHYTLRCWKKFF